MRLTDALFWLMHRDGRPRVRQARTLGLALAAGLLGELVLAGTVDRLDRRVVIATDAVDRGDGNLVLHYRPPPDPSLAGYYDAILHNQFPGYDMPGWLEAIRDHSLRTVTTRLHHDGYLKPVSSRRSWLRLASSSRYVVTDPRTAFQPWALLSRRLYPPSSPLLGDRDAYLIGLMSVTGLRNDLLAGTPEAAHRHADQLVNKLPPLLRQLVAETETCLGKDVMAYRT